MAGKQPEVTEIKKLAVSRADGVKSPANGTKFLFMKAVNAAGGIDEKPDIAGAESVLQQLAKLISAEADEMAVGQWSESYDIQLLSEAVSLMQMFLWREQDGDEDDGEGLAKDIETFVAKRKINTAERKRLASEGKALPDGSYPIENAEDLKNAAILARSGHGDVAAAKRLIAKRAKELGVANPLANDAQKETEEETSAAVEQPETPEAPDVEALVKEAVAEATKSHEEALKELRDELAKVKATPLPGGPAITVPQSVRNDRERDDLMAKAVRYERLAETVSEHDMKKYYQAEAKKAREKAAAKA